jgi:hypothetical protein
MDAAATDTSTDSTKRFTYLVLNMVDGRQDDIGWFVCQVLQFVGAGQALGQNTLIHCEKGISRYCSFPLLSPSSCGFPRSRGSGSWHSKQCVWKREGFCILGLLDMVYKIDEKDGIVFCSFLKENRCTCYLLLHFLLFIYFSSPPLPSSSLRIHIHLYLKKNRLCSFRVTKKSAKVQAHSVCWQGPGQGQGQGQGQGPVLAAQEGMG